MHNFKMILTFIKLNLAILKFEVALTHFCKCIFSFAMFKIERSSSYLPEMICEIRFA